MKLSKKFFRHREAAKVVSIYMLFGFLWIYFSDTIVGWMVHDEKIITIISIFKGSFFIVFTSCLLFFLIVRLQNKIDQSTNELRQNEERFRLLVKNSSDSLVIVNADGSQRYVSPASERITGFPVSELEGRTLDTIIHPDDMANVMAAWDEVIRNPENVITVQYRHIHKTDGWVYSEAIAQSFLDEPAINGVIASVRDITKQKESADLLRLRESYLSAIIENLPGLIWLKDIDGRFLTVNAEFAKSCGLKDPQLLVGKTDLDIWPKDLAEKYMTDDTGVLSSKKPLSTEEPIFDKGVLRWYETFKAPVADNKGIVIGTTGYARDITERKQDEKALRESEIELQNLLQTIQAGIVVHDVEKNRVKKFNQAALKILGLKEQQLLGKSTIDPGWGFIDENGEILTVDDYPVNIVKKTRKPLVDYVVGITNSSEKEPTWVIIKANPNINQSGKLTEIIVSSMDITELRNTREQLRKKDQQLLQAQKMEAIGTLAGGIAHDFNNILGAILGYAEMVQEDCPTGSTMRSDIDRVVEASHRAKDLVRQILAFSRQTETDERALQPALIIKEAIKMLRASFPATIDIQQNIDPEAGLIFADPTQIHQIITNLCTNAFHSMEDTGGTLNISLKNIELTRADIVSEPHVQPGHFVEISVGDTGSGIAPEITDKMFDPFFTTKEVGKGTGMGLAIIHGIAKKSGGFVSWKSSPGEGTIFYVYLPVHAATNSLEIESTPFELIETGVERILFVDDEEMLAEMAKTMLQRLGYKVTVETNSIKALKIIQNKPDLFDLVITDQTMPGMTGSDLARRVLQIRPELPIILCTGFSNQISEDKAKLFGIKGFAMKPLAKKDLAALIRKVLDGEK